MNSTNATPGHPRIRRAIAGVLAAGLASTTFVLFSGTADAAPLRPTRDCADVPVQLFATTAGGAGAGVALGGVYGGLVGLGLGFIAGSAGGCTQVIEGTPHPAP